MNNEHIILKPYSVSELAALYNVSSKVMKRWLTNIEAITGKRRGRYYTIVQAQQVFLQLGIPAHYKE